MEEPFFIVGSPRSGTTLIRTILDSHSRLAVPPESHFIIALAPGKVPWRRQPASVDDVLRHPAVARWGIEPSSLRRAVAEAHPKDYAEFVSAIFAFYAASRGKPRWGDKTPGYVSYLPKVVSLFPDARFIHVIRDGREVAASLSERSWGTRTAIGGAVWWRRKVSRGLKYGRRLPPSRYMEIRLEDLIADPEGRIGDICDFLGESFEPGMLRYYERFQGQSLGPDVAHLAKPISGGLRDWREGRSRWERRAIEAICRPLLAALDYPAPGPDPLALCWARLVWARDLVLDGPRALRHRLKPRVRTF